MSVGVVCDSEYNSPELEDHLARLKEICRLGVHRVPMRRLPALSDIRAVRAIRQIAGETEAQILHGHGAKGGAYARLATPGRRVLRAYTPHGGSLLLNHDNMSGRMYLALERLLLARRSLYLFESAYSGRIFRDKIGTPNGSVRVIHNGVSQSEFAPVTPVPDATDLVFIGEFRPVKGIDILIDALARLHDSGRTVTATLIGSGPEKASLEAQVKRLELQNSIRFLPAMPARKALALGRIMVIPSRAESLPYVVLEAAAAGHPLITTNVGGIPEIYGPLSANLIPAGDTQELADAIARRIDEPAQAASLAAELRQRVSAAFSVDTMVDGVIAAYVDAMADAIPVRNAVLAAE